MIMTMSKLAKLANVSVSTVSKAFSDAPDINAETKDRIFEKARQTGCYYKFYKGKYPKKIIAIICQEIISDFYVEFVDRLRKQIESSNNIALVVTDDFSTLNKVFEDYNIQIEQMGDRNRWEAETEGDIYELFIFEGKGE